jgi:hypothetical protein
VRICYNEHFGYGQSYAAERFYGFFERYLRQSFESVDNYADVYFFTCGACGRGVYLELRRLPYVSWEYGGALASKLDQCDGFGYGEDDFVNG